MTELVYVFSAFALGALHALEPGHGKTVVAAYLVGSKGRVSDAVTLGGVVTFTHTFSIIVLGLLTAVAAAYLVPETVHLVLEVVSGLLVVGVGIWMVYDRIIKGRLSLGHAHGDEHVHDETSLPSGVLAASSPAGAAPRYGARTQPALVFAGVESVHYHGQFLHSHPLPAGQTHHHNGTDTHGDYARGHLRSRYDQSLDYDHGHSHEQGYGHNHALPTGARPTLGSLVTLGVSGGIVPCPAALALLLAAVAAGNIIGGVSLVVVFSLGLAVVLIAIGILLVKAADLATKILGEKADVSPITRYAGAASAVIVTLLGIGMTVRAVLEVSGLRLF